MAQTYVWRHNEWKGGRLAAQYAVKNGFKLESLISYNYPPRIF